MQRDGHGLMSDRTHDLKCHPGPFVAIWTGRKTFECRRAFDRYFREGDTLILREWEPDVSEYTGRSITAEVTYLMKGGDQPTNDMLPGSTAVMALCVLGRDEE